MSGLRSADVAQRAEALVRKASALSMAVDKEAWAASGTLADDLVAELVRLRNDALRAAGEESGLLADMRSTQMWREAGMVPSEVTVIPPADEAKPGSWFWRFLTKGGRL
jgi:hypothetical protein